MYRRLPADEDSEYGSRLICVSALIRALDLIGLEFLKTVAGVEARKGVPVVMITTEGSEARVVEALSAGARGYLRKPFTPEQVKERVTPLLANAM
jgi:DNA-binding response OmpR family regulator